MIDLSLPLPVYIHTGSDLTALAVQAALRAARIQTAPLCPDETADGILLIDDYTASAVQPNTTLRHILLTHQREPLLLQSLLAAGLNGCLYLGDSLVERLPGAVRDVAAGGVYLSPTPAAVIARLEHYHHHIQPRLTAYQRDLLRLTAQHWSAGRIAAHLGRTRAAIYQAQSLLRDLFAVQTNGELIERAGALGLLAEMNLAAAGCEVSEVKNSDI